MRYKNLFQKNRLSIPFMEWVWLVVLILLTISVLSARASVPILQFRHITPQNGLPHNFIQDIIQDHDGFIWLATAAGLSRYDGLEFRTYTSGHAKTDLHGNYIVALLQDRRGRIWVGTKNNGLSRLDTATQTFTHFGHDPTASSTISSNSIANKALYEDIHGTIWVGTNHGGLDAIDPETGSVTHYTENFTGYSKLGITSVLSIAGIPGDMAGRFLFIGTNIGLVQLDLKYEKVRHFPLRSTSTKGVEVPVNTLYVESERVVWVGTTHGLIMLDSKTGDQTAFIHKPDDPATLSHNVIKDIQPGENSILWIATEGGGLNRLDLSTRAVNRYTNDGANDLSLASDQLSCLLRDRTGALWIGAQGFGLDYLDPQLQKFTVYRPSSNSAGALSNALILDIFIENDNNIWLGTGGGLNKFSPQSQVFTTYNVPASSFIHNVFVDSRGDHWVGTWGAGVYRFDPTTGEFTPFTLKGMTINRCFCFFEDNKGQLWIGTGNQGLYVISPDRVSFKQFSRISQDSNSLSDNLVHRVVEDSHGSIWVATLNGLNRYREQSGDFIRYLHDPNDQNSLSDNSVKNILEDSNGILWLTTDSGLNRFDPVTGSFTAYFKGDGLPHNRVDSIIEDDAGFFWIGTPNGMSRFDPSAQTFINFDHLDGLQGNIFNLVAKKDNQGHLYFTGAAGLQVFNPDAIIANYHEPPMAFLSYMVSNRVIDRAPENEMVLGPDHNSFGFEFVALSYTQPVKNRYSYKLEGFDRDWHMTKERRVRYTNLDPGNYLFRVKGSNDDGIWNEEGIAIPVRILPAWWETNLFRGITAFLILLTLWQLQRWGIRLIKARNAQLKSMVVARTAELEKVNSQLQTLAQTDALTKISNRLKIDKVLGREVDRFLRYGNYFSVILIDLDHFKQVNDTYGHQVGDDILKAVALLLDKNTRTTDTVGRWGGEEFIVICPETTLDKTERKAEQLRQLLAHHAFPSADHQTGSFGVGTFTKGDTLTNFFTRIDNALYTAKREGRNRVVTG